MGFIGDIGRPTNPFGIDRDDRDTDLYIYVYVICGAFLAYLGCFFKDSEAETLIKSWGRSRASRCLIFMSI